MSASDSTDSPVQSVVETSRSREASSSHTATVTLVSASASSVKKWHSRLRVVTFCRCFEADGSELHEPDSFCSGPWVHAVAAASSVEAPRMAYASLALAERGLAILRTADEGFLERLFSRGRVRQFL